MGGSWDTLQSRSNHCSRPAPPTHPNMESSSFKTTRKLKMAPTVKQTSALPKWIFRGKPTGDVTMTPHIQSVEGTHFREAGLSWFSSRSITGSDCNLSRAAACRSGNRKAQRRWVMISASGSSAAPAFGRQTLHLSWSLLRL